MNVLSEHTECLVCGTAETHYRICGEWMFERDQDDANQIELRSLCAGCYDPRLNVVHVGDERVFDVHNVLAFSGEPVEFSAPERSATRRIVRRRSRRIPHYKCSPPIDILIPRS